MSDTTAPSARMAASRRTSLRRCRRRQSWVSTVQPTRRRPRSSATRPTMRPGRPTGFATTTGRPRALAGGSRARAVSRRHHDRSRGVAQVLVAMQTDAWPLVEDPPDHRPDAPLRAGRSGRTSRVAPRRTQQIQQQRVTRPSGPSSKVSASDSPQWSYPRRRRSHAIGPGRGRRGPGTGEGRMMRVGVALRRGHRHPRHRRYPRRHQLPPRAGLVPGLSPPRHRLPLWRIHRHIGMGETRW